MLQRETKKRLKQATKYNNITIKIEIIDWKLLRIFDEGQRHLLTAQYVTLLISLLLPSLSLVPTIDHHFILPHITRRGRDSSVGIATGYWLDGPGI
jgi:hypothetical protein